MTTITIKNGQPISQTQFDNIAELQEYLISIQIENGHNFSKIDKQVLDNRLQDLEKNPANFVSLQELKENLTRGNV